MRLLLFLACLFCCEAGNNAPAGKFVTITIEQPAGSYEEYQRAQERIVIGELERVETIATDERRVEESDEDDEEDDDDMSDETTGPKRRNVVPLRGLISCCGNKLAEHQSLFKINSPFAQGRWVPKSIEEGGKEWPVQLLVNPGGHKFEVITVREAYNLQVVCL
jgi:hypothetical protein